MSMNTIKIIRYQLQDVLRSRWVLGYALFFLVATDALFRFGGSGERVVLSLLNAVLIVIPLVSIVLGAMYLYNAREYIELLLAQPIQRGSLFIGLYVGFTLPLVLAFAAGVGLPFLYHGALGTADAGPIALLLVTGSGLTVIFVALAFGLALLTEDRIKGVGAALVVWLFFAVVYNGLVLMVIQVYADYPLQKTTIALALLNPIDLGRILLLLNLDVSAMMGFTGAVFQRFFGSASGQMLSAGAMAVWLAVPLLLGRRAFLRRNF
jgi:Cu-processing system permease protein